MLPNSEWILLSLLAIALLKPADVPVIAKFLAKLIKQGQQLWNDLVLDEISKQNCLTSSEQNLKKHPFHIAPPRAKSQPLKD